MVNTGARQGKAGRSVGALCQHAPQFAPEWGALRQANVKGPACYLIRCLVATATATATATDHADASPGRRHLPPHRQACLAPSGARGGPTHSNAAAGPIVGSGRRMLGRLHGAPTRPAGSSEERCDTAT
jgi:hypothetical protein